MSPYVRTVKTASGARAVQIVYSSRRGSREIEHIGSAHDEAELETLKAVARQRLAAGQTELDLGLDGPAEGGPLEIISSRMEHLYDALDRAYAALGFGAATGGDEAFRQLVLARLVAKSAGKLSPRRLFSSARPSMRRACLRRRSGMPPNLDTVPAGVGRSDVQCVSHGMTNRALCAVHGDQPAVGGDPIRGYDEVNALETRTRTVARASAASCASSLHTPTALVIRSRLQAPAHGQTSPQDPGSSPGAAPGETERRAAPYGKRTGPYIWRQSSATISLGAGHVVHHQDLRPVGGREVVTMAGARPTLSPCTQGTQSA